LNFKYNAEAQGNNSRCYSFRDGKSSNGWNQSGFNIEDSCRNEYFNDNSNACYGGDNGVSDNINLNCNNKM